MSNMANNRLYIGDTANKKYVCISKGYGHGWRELNTEAISGINKIITSIDLIQETNLGGKTALQFFTEGDELWDVVFDKDSEWKRMT